MARARAWLEAYVRFLFIVMGSVMLFVLAIFPFAWFWDRFGWADWPWTVRIAGFVVTAAIYWPITAITVISARELWRSSRRVL